MILVAGLTPAWQQIAVLDRLSVGEVNRAREVHWCASGKVLNVGLALTQLGAKARSLSLVGSGSAREAIQSEMALMGVDVQWVESSGTQRSCTTLLDCAAGQTTEIVENSATASLEELLAFATAFARQAVVTKCDLVVLTGSLPQGAPRNFYSELIQRTPNRLILDVRGPELLETLLHRPLVVKPNREELAQTVGQSLPNDNDVWQAMSELHDRGARWIVVTDGPDDVFVSHQDRQANGRWRCTPPRVQVVNPIGCGDCLTAGLAFAVQYHDGGVLEAIQFGIAAAACNATKLLPARLNLQEVMSMAGQVVTASTA